MGRKSGGDGTHGVDKARVGNSLIILAQESNRVKEVEIIKTVFEKDT